MYFYTFVSVKNIVINNKRKSINCLNNVRSSRVVMEPYTYYSFLYISCNFVEKKMNRSFLWLAIVFLFKLTSFFRNFSLKTMKIYKILKKFSLILPYYIIYQIFNVSTIEGIANFVRYRRSSLYPGYQKCTLNLKRKIPLLFLLKKKMFKKANKNSSNNL